MQKVKKRRLSKQSQTECIVSLQASITYFKVFDFVKTFEVRRFTSGIIIASTAATVWLKVSVFSGFGMRRWFRLGG